MTTTVAPRAQLKEDAMEPRQSLMRYRSLRKSPSQPSVGSSPPPPMPASSMAQAAASASLQRSQSRYHKPTNAAQAQPRSPPTIPKGLYAAASTGQLRSQRPPQQQPRPHLPKQHSSPSQHAHTQDIRAQHSQPSSRHKPSPRPVDTPPTAPNTLHIPYRGPSKQQPAAQASPTQVVAPADSRRLFELEARRQRQVQERLRAQRDDARQAESHRQDQRSRDAQTHMIDADRARNTEIRREALRLKAEADARIQEAVAAQQLEEKRQDERIKALARQKYAENERERKEEERRQMLLDEQNLAAMEVKREEHRQKIEEKQRKQEQKERRLVERESQKNLRAALGSKAAVGGTGFAERILSGGTDNAGPKSEGRMRHISTLRRRESDRPAMLRHKSSMEVFTGVFRRNSEAVKPLETVGTRFEDVVERVQPVFIKKSAAPGIDAPISASNAGERRVLVQCGDLSMYLPVTPTTTPVDLIYSASNVLSKDIEPQKSVLLEHFEAVGLQRPLRKYEHIRDVLNSWDDDKQNSLHLVPSATGGKDADLEASTVVNLESPSDQTFLMYYSQRPGKWDKRYITLRTDGQVVHSRKPTAKDFSTICHMSDFDVYSPMPQALDKKINPPKKLCFGVKSQQKYTFFQSTENFVHYFSTGDTAIATAWYSAIQGWRSWYLVNVMGEGQTSRLQPSSAAHGLDVDAQTAFAQGDKRSSHYQLGSFKPLLDPGLFGKPDESRTHAEQSPTPPATSRNAGPPNSYRSSAGTKSSPQHRARNSSTSSSAARPDKDTTFTATGLLGQAYAQRQREQDASAMEQAGPAGPFIEGPSLLSEIDAALGGIGRSTTRKERGSARGLVESATTLDTAGKHRAHASQSGRPPASKDGGSGGEVFKPLLDVNSGSLFAGGSLLHQAELEGKIKRDNGPIIARSKGVEVSVETGEGR